MEQGRSRRSLITLRRRKRQAARLSAAEQTAQERARIQKEISRQLRRWTPRTLVAWGLIFFAAVMALNHVLMHLGLSWLPMSAGQQDLLVGWPVAGVIAVVGAITFGSGEPSKKTSRK